MALLTIQKNLTMPMVLKATINQELVKKLPVDTLHKMVCAVLRLFCESLNVSQSMTPVQVYEAAGFWLERSPTESIKDLILCLKRAKQGDYGKLYNRFDSEVLGEFWSAYMNEKVTYRQNLHRDQKSAEEGNARMAFAQIEINAPGALRAFANRKDALQRDWAAKMTTPDVKPALETYLDILAHHLPSMLFSEMATLRSEAVAKCVPDVIALIDAEHVRRESDRAADRPYQFDIERTESSYPQA